MSSSISSSDPAVATAAASRRFLIIFVVFLLAFLPAGLANYLFLRNAGELEPIERVAANQQREPGLYGTALYENSYPYKLALLAARQPDVVALGSSRVLQLRQDHFAARFLNLGRTVNYPREAEKLVADMLAITRPRVAIFALDFWWAAEASRHAFNFNAHTERGADLRPDAVIAPARWLSEGKIPAALYIEILSTPPPYRTDGIALYGVQSITVGNGFGPDGSYYYGATVFGRAPAADPRFSDTLRRIASNSAQFVRNTRFVPERVDSLKRAISTLETAGVTVITYLPPLAPPVRAAMAVQEDAYAHVTAFRAAVATATRPHFDFHDDIFDSCEFVDGFHHGDVIAARLLLGMASARPDVFGGIVDTAALTTIVTKAAGQAQAGRSFSRAGDREADFLDLGCKRNANIHISN